MVCGRFVGLDDPQTWTAHLGDCPECIDAVKVCPMINTNKCYEADKFNCVINSILSIITGSRIQFASHGVAGLKIQFEEVKSVIHTMIINLHDVSLSQSGIPTQLILKEVGNLPPSLPSMVFGNESINI